MAIVEEEIVGVLKIMAEKHSSMVPKVERPTFEDCLNRLNEFGWEDDPLYDVALAIFCEPNDHYRQAWMKMKVENCANWVKMIGRSKGFTWSDHAVGFRNVFGMVMDLEEEMLFLILLFWFVRRRYNTRIERIKDNNSALSGHAYTQELLTGSNTQCQEMLRLSRDAFVSLCDHFKERNWLQHSRHISVEEKMAIFLTILGQNDRVRSLKRRFQHSTETIHSCFHEVLQGMMKFAKEIIRPTNNDVASSMSNRQRKLRQIFQGAIGALDGTLVHAIVSIKQQTAYRGRGGGRCYQNVLGICDFNMVFIFVWAGWEGIAHDSRILTEVVFNPTSGFPFPPPNKYYLCDAAYANTRGFLALFRNTRYWLADFRRRRALTKEEKFNHAHAQLRNVIERAYGVLKNRFPILSKMAPYKFSTQRNMVIACFAIHNYIRKWNLHDELFLEEDNLASNEVQSEEQVQEQPEESAEEEVDGTQWGTQSTQYMADLRNEIATRLVTNRV